jgi:hypothetical protein
VEPSVALINRTEPVFELPTTLPDNQAIQQIVNEHLDRRQRDTAASAEVHRMFPDASVIAIERLRSEVHDRDGLQQLVAQLLA